MNWVGRNTYKKMNELKELSELERSVERSHTIDIISSRGWLKPIWTILRAIFPSTSEAWQRYLSFSIFVLSFHHVYSFSYPLSLPHSHTLLLPLVDNRLGHDPEFTGISTFQKSIRLAPRIPHEISLDTPCSSIYDFFL